MRPPNKTTRVGETRPSSLMYQHGVGGLHDLPHFSVLLGGLDQWPPGEVLHEPRLLEAVQRHMPSVTALRLPPLAPDLPPIEAAYQRVVGVPVHTMPGWLVCSRCRLLSPAADGLFQLRRDTVNPYKNKYVHKGCRAAGGRAPIASPVRFLTACPNGHLDEFPWHYFLHDGAPCAGMMELFDTGHIGEYGSIYLKCTTCDRSRYLTDAFGERGKRSMPRCRGLHPHLAQTAPDPCSHRMTTVTVGSANVWFPIQRSALSLPLRDEVDTTGRLVAQYWENLKNLATPEALDQVLALAPTIGILHDLTAALQTGDTDLEKIRRAVTAHHGRLTSPPAGRGTGTVDLQAPEWALLTGFDAHVCTDHFEAVVASVPDDYRHLIARVALVERLREVTVLTGFTRLEGYDKVAASEGEGQVQPAPLSLHAPTWLPAAETRGEGIFIQFHEDVVAAWARDPATAERRTDFFQAHAAQRTLYGYPDPNADFPDLRFVFLHSFAHLLMRRMALECGYSLAGLREKIYSHEPGAATPMAGILIYTAQADSEGSLGGLVALGRGDLLGGFIDQALEQGALCASDPLCAEHRPSTEGHPSLHGACCHACLFLPESSCCRGNRYLDRSTIVATVHRADLALCRKPPA